MTIQSKIIREIMPYLAGIYAPTLIIFGVRHDWVGIYSMILGASFSVFGLFRLACDQANVLLNKNRRAVMISFFIRLSIVAVPIIIALKKTNYFKFSIVLIFLFSSQLIFIVKELVTNYLQYKKRIH